MHIYARIRSIEEQENFKRLVNTLLGAEYPGDFEATKDWHDFGIDGRLKSTGTIYAVYCPKYPERKEQSQYKTKIESDIKKLVAAVKNNNVTFDIKKWCFVTPDDLSVETIEYIDRLAKENGWESHTLTAQTLAPLFMKHNLIHVDFPDLMAGLYYDKVPSVYVKFIDNKGYQNLEIFNNGTEDIQDLTVETSEDGTAWQNRVDHFLFEFDNPMQGYTHSCHTLKKSERQFVSNVPTVGGFYYRVSGLGVESRKTFNQEGRVPRRA